MPRDPRNYITVHDGLPEHPKVEPLSDAAFRLLITVWCYCSKNLTDGHVTRAAWEKRGTKRTREELVAAGLAVVQPDLTIEMHDYTEHQRTAVEVEEMRTKRAEAGRRGGLAKASNRVASATASANGVAKQTASNVLSKPLANPASKPLAESDKSKKKEQRVRDTSRFEEFWEVYPAKKGKAAAERNWASLMRRGVDPQRIIDGAKAYAAEMLAKDDPKYKYPQGWLTDGRWEDEPETVDAPKRQGFYSAPAAPDDMPRSLFVTWNRAHFEAHQAGRPGPVDWHELEHAS